MTPDELGKIVRQAWVKYCKETGWRTSPDTICDWEDMTDEHAKEVDRRIGVAVARAAEAAARTDGWRKGAAAMREAAVEVCRNPRVAPMTLGSIFGGDTIPFIAREHLADAVAALPLPEPPAAKE